MARQAEWEVDTGVAAPRRRRAWLWVLVLLLIAFGGGLFAMGYALTHWDAAARYIRPPKVVTLVAPAPRPLVRPMPAGPLAPAAEDVALDRRVDALEGALHRTEARADAAQGNAGRAEGLLIAFAARRALDRGVQLGYVEGLLRERFGGTQPQAVAAVIAAAHRPVTLADLQAGLDRVAPELGAGGPEASWWDNLHHELTSLVVLRRVDEPSTVPADRLLRARRALEQGQADVALAEVARLPGRAAAEEWIAAARRYAAARNALDILETAALLAPREPEPPSIVPDAAPAVAAAVSE